MAEDFEEQQPAPAFDMETLTASINANVGAQLGALRGEFGQLLEQKIAERLAPLEHHTNRATAILERLAPQETVEAATQVTEEQRARALADARLRQIEQQLAPKPQPPVDPDRHAFYNVIVPGLEEYAKARNLTLDQVAAKLPKGLGPDGLRGYDKQAKAVIDAEAARIRQAAEPRVVVDNTRPGGGGGRTTYTTADLTSNDASVRAAAIAAFYDK